MYKLKLKFFENRIKEYININYCEEGIKLYFQVKMGGDNGYFESSLFNEFIAPKKSLIEEYF